MGKFSKTRFFSHKIHKRIVSTIDKKLSEILHHIYDASWFSENFISSTEVPLESIQKLEIDHIRIEIQNHSAENQPLTFTNVPENTDTSLQASPIKNIESKTRASGE